MRKMGPVPFNSPNADLTIRTSTDTTFMVHRAILAAASPVLAAKIASAATEATEQGGKSAAQGSQAHCEIALPESDFVVETLLRFIYPLPDPVLLDLDDIVDVYVGYLRRKLEESGAQATIHTVRGVGYALRDGLDADGAR